LITKRYNQEEGTDFDETFEPIARLKAICILLGFAAHMGINLFQMDVKCAFLNGCLSDEVYVEQHHRFDSFGFKNHVFKRHKALYGLKQALIS